MSKVTSRGNPIQSNPVLNIAGSAAQMHSRDYIEIINVIYKDDHNGCCGKTHKSKSTCEKPIMRKTWDVRQKKWKHDWVDERKAVRESAITSSSRVYRQKSGTLSSTRLRKQQSDTFSERKPGFLPDIYSQSSSKISTPPPFSTAGRAKSAHHSKTRVSKEGKPQACGCHEGLLYLRKTHEWQTLLNEYRNEILKLRDVLKEKDKPTQSRKQLKRSNTQEKHDNLNDILREHRFNSYHLLRMRMEERMRHEHRVFERLSERTSNLTISSTSDIENCRVNDELSSSSQPITSSPESSSPSGISSADDEFSDEWKLLPKQMKKKSDLLKQKHKQAMFATTTAESGFHSQRGSGGLLSKRKTQQNSLKVHSTIDHHHHNHQQPAQVEISSTKKLPKVVVRKRVVRCPCLKHKDM